MRDGDGGNSFDAQRIVEKNAAATVHLRIDEAGQHPAAGKVVRVGLVGEWRYCSNAALIDVDFCPLEHTRSCCDMTARKPENGHRVLVTLARPGGASGSIPKESESCSAIR